MRFLYCFGLGCLVFFSSYNSIRPADKLPNLLDNLGNLGNLGILTNIIGIINNGADKDIKVVTDIMKEIPPNMKRMILNKLLFNNENEDKNMWYKHDKNEGECIIAFHGLGGNTNEFKDFGELLADAFGCDCIGIGYNSLFDVGDINNSVKTLFKKVSEIVNNENNKYTKYILFGYSLGVNVAALLGQWMKQQNISFDFIGYKGYSSAENCLKGFLTVDFIKKSIINVFGSNEIIKNFIESLKLNNNDLKEINIDLFLENKAAKEFKAMTNNVANIGGLKNEKSVLALLNTENGIKEEHGWDTLDIGPIKTKYDEIKNDGNQVIILVVADKDSVVGNGMSEVFKTINDVNFKPEELPTFNNPPGPQHKPDDDEDGANNCGDCCKDCCPPSGGS